MSLSIVLRESKGKDRHDGRPIIYNNVVKQRAGTVAEDVGGGSRIVKYTSILLISGILLQDI